MGIVQDNDGLLGQPEVNVTSYGAEYVNAATETPVSEEPEVEDAVPAAGGEPATVKEEKPKKKPGRGRKSK